jgi:predicted PurR-regulated permease PerM
LMERSLWFRAATVLITLGAVVFIFSALGRLWGFLGDLILIFFLAWLMGSVLIHTVNSLMRVPHMTRPIAILLVYLGLITLIADFAFLVVPATVNQVLDLTEIIPQQVGRLPELVAGIEDIFFRFGLEVNLQNQVQFDSVDELAESATAFITDNAINILQDIVSAAFAISLVIVISFYIVMDGGRRLNESLKVLPPNAEREARFVLQTIDETFVGYVRGMLIISLIYGVGTATVMLSLGLPAALPAALISSLLLAVPFIGDWLALALPLIIAAFAGDFIDFLIVLVSLLFIQQVMLNLLTPRILGRAVHMPAMLVIIAVVLGARLAGVPGALLGVPTAGVIHTFAVAYGTRIRERREQRDVDSRAIVVAAQESPDDNDGPSASNQSGTANGAAITQATDEASASDDEGASSGLRPIVIAGGAPEGTKTTSSASSALKEEMGRALEPHPNKTPKPRAPRRKRPQA